MAMKIDRIQPAGMNVRIQQGKPAYSHVVTVTGPGKTIYIAGQLARDAEGAPNTSLAVIRPKPRPDSPTASEISVIMLKSELPHEAPNPVSKKATRVHCPIGAPTRKR